MSIKLSALALGITLAYGATAAMAADEASIYQNGWFNNATVAQNDNTTAIASISQTGSFNTGTISQELVNNGDAAIYQAASAGTAAIEQGGSWSSGHWAEDRHHRRGHKGDNDRRWVEGTWSDGYNQSATITQSYGWGNTGWIKQTGSNADASIYQGGYDNLANIIQAGNGVNTAGISQTGLDNEGNITQTGSALVANIYQTGIRQLANIVQTGSDKTAIINQAGGYHNVATITQH